jgi:hypothetical protein
MITSVRWVPVGAARRVPIKEDIDAEMAVTEHMLAQQQEAAMELRGEEGEEKQEEGGVVEMAVEGEEAEDDEDDGEEPLLQIGQDVRDRSTSLLACTDSFVPRSWSLKTMPTTRTLIRTTTATRTRTWKSKTGIS